MPWHNKNRKHQKLIYSTELGLNKIKNPFFGGNFDGIIILNAVIFVYFTVLAYTQSPEPKKNWVFGLGFGYSTQPKAKP